MPYEDYRSFNVFLYMCRLVKKECVWTTRKLQRVFAYQKKILLVWRKSLWMKQLVGSLIQFLKLIYYNDIY